MEKWTDKDIENLIKNCSITDPVYKEELRKRFTEDGFKLSLDDLDAVAGGVRSSVKDEWAGWFFPGDE